MDKYRLYGLDVETACAVEGCEDKECRHALDHNRARITCVAVTDGLFDEHVFRDKETFADWKRAHPEAKFTMQNGKFDMKQLITHNWLVHLSDWVDDSSLLAYNHYEHVSPSWLDEYDEQRVAHNKLRTGLKHRKAGQYSLKTLAPYFLGVKPFWEPESGHDDDEYVLKDARYCLQLTEFFKEKLAANFPKNLEFYQRCHLPWTKALIFPELQGIRVDEDKLKLDWAKSEDEEKRVANEIREQWQEHFIAWYSKQANTLEVKYKTRLEKLKTPKAKALVERNWAKAHDRIGLLNLDSPQQLKWLLKERLNLDPTNLDGEESTDKETLTTLAEETPAIKKLLTYRKIRKLNSTYYPEYLNYIYKGRIHTSYHSIGTRTGRLSASDPNIQQVPAALHELFIADEGYTLITRDLSAIEPTILAYYSEDPVLCDLMLNEGDFHSTNAHTIFSLDCDIKQVKELYPRERKIAKECGLAVLYGAGAGRIHQVLTKHGMKHLSYSDAQTFVYRLRDLYAGVWRFKQDLDRELESGATIYNLLGRPIRIPYVTDVYMQALNTLIQSSASDVLQAAAYKLHHDYNVLLLVHDELVIQVKEEAIPRALIDIEEALTNSLTLNTQYGRIPIKIEGKESKTWSK